MRAPFKRHVKPIGAKWLRTGIHGGSNSDDYQPQFRQSNENQDPQFSPINQEVVMYGGNSKGNEIQNSQISGIIEMRNHHSDRPTISANNIKKDIIVVETKKRKTDEITGLDEPIDHNTELMMESETGPLKITSPNNNSVSKNGEVVSTQGGARLVL